MSKFDMTEDELKEFIKLNKEKIVELIKEDAPGIKEKAENDFSKLNDKASEKLKGMKDDGKQFLSAVTSAEVQKHFISAGMEFMLGFLEIAKSFPIPESMTPVSEKISEVRETASETFCAKNPDCAKKKKIEKIEID